MAEEDAKKDGENKEEVDKKSNLIIIIVVAFLVLLLLIGGIVMFIFSGGDEEVVNNKQVIQSEASVNEDTQNQPTKSYRSKSSLTVGPMFELDTFIVNLLSENGRRYLKVKINLELSDEELTNELNSKMPVIRDIVIRVASSKTLEEISTEKGKEKFKDQVVSELNFSLKDGKIKNVFFTDFVIQ
jgi:flagellar FliL protein